MFDCDGLIDGFTVGFLFFLVPSVSIGEISIFFLEIAVGVMEVRVDLVEG